MKRIPKQVRRAAQKQIEINALELNVAQRQAAPRDDGILNSTIHYEDLTGLNIGVRVVAGGGATTRPVRNGQSATYDYALAAQFGRDGQVGTNFFFGPYRLRRRKFKSRITRAVKKAILA